LKPWPARYANAAVTFIAKIEFTDPRNAKRFVQFPLRHAYLDIFGMVLPQLRGVNGEICIPDEVGTGNYDLVCSLAIVAEDPPAHDRALLDRSTEAPHAARILGSGREPKGERNDPIASIVTLAAALLEFR
jgi:hypothetical protein